ncbi:MAG: trypsin-like serine protease, partial [Lachnospiraceae bacterium]|nr:trypsin-like serine protease [Lachnospiraceae bacterium]
SLPSNITSNCIPSCDSTKVALQHQFRNYAQSFEERVVKIQTTSGYGTGFIIGDHLIATAAHVVYSRIDHTGIVSPQSSRFVVSNIIAHKFDSNHNKTTTNLTVNSIHIPDKFVNPLVRSTTDPEQDDVVKYDYALICVQQSLQSVMGYDKYEFGLFLDGVPTISNNGTTSALDVEITGFPGLSGFPDNLVSSAGKLDNYSLNHYAAIMQCNAGASGSPCYIHHSTYSNTSPQTVFGILTGGVNSYHGGTIATRPFLQFYFNNPYTVAS